VNLCFTASGAASAGKGSTAHLLNPVFKVKVQLNLFATHNKQDLLPPARRSLNESRGVLTLKQSELKEATGLTFLEFLEIPVDDRWASLTRIRYLPLLLYEFRLRSAQKRKALTEARRARDGKVLALKHSILADKNPNTGRAFSLELAEELARAEYPELQAKVDELDQALLETEAYLKTLEDMNGLMKGEQGRWNRENDGEKIG